MVLVAPPPGTDFGGRARTGCPGVSIILLGMCTVSLGKHIYAIYSHFNICKK